MANSLASNWRENILNQLQDRNKIETKRFEELIAQSKCGSNLTFNEHNLKFYVLILL